MMPATPLLKWVGGKRQLLPELSKYIPATFGRYHEPFLGGGALFFALAADKRLGDGASLSDANLELVNVYQRVRDDVSSVVEHLKEMEPRQDKDTYLAVRQSFNEHSLGECSQSWRAAQFIYLNKVGFNGLHRVNASGKFNVPHGKRSAPVVFDAENLRACSAALQCADVTPGDFFERLARAAPGDLVYCDPPYAPVSDTANFTGYTAGGFGPSQQKTLRDLARDLSKRGVNVILSNADVPSIRELYALPCFELHAVQAKRAINCDAGKRGAVGELIITAGASRGRSPRGADSIR